MMIAFSILLFFFESMTGLLSHMLCQKLCGEHYVSSIEPTIVDLSCGFHAELYLYFSLILTFVFGMVVNILLSRRTVEEQRN